MELLPALPLLIYLLSLPFLPYAFPGATWTTITLFDWQRILQFLVLIASILLSILLRKGNFLPYPGPTALVAALAFLILGWFSTGVNSVAWFDSVHQISLYALSLLCFWSIWLSFGCAPADEREALATFLLGASASLYTMVFLWGNRDILFWLWYPDSLPGIMGFSNVRFFNDYQVLVLPFLIYSIASACHGRISQVAGWGWICFFCMIFFYTGGRAAVIGQLGMHVLLVVLLGRRYLPTLRRHVFAWSGGYVFFIFFSSLLPAFFSVDTNNGETVQSALRNNLSYRDALFKMALDDIQHHPWLGIGPGEFSRSLNTIAASPHNSLMAIAAEWGLPALVLAMFFLGRWLLRSLAALKVLYAESPARTDFTIACWLACGATLIESMFENVLEIPTTAVGLVLVAGMATATTVDCARARTEVRQPLRFACNAGYLLLVAMSIGLATYVLVRDVPHLPARNSAYLECRIPTSFFSPRFWQQGWLINRCPDPSAIDTTP